MKQNKDGLLTYSTLVMLVFAGIALASEGAGKVISIGISLMSAIFLGIILGDNTNKESE